MAYPIYKVTLIISVHFKVSFYLCFFQGSKFPGKPSHVYPVTCNESPACQINICLGKEEEKSGGEKGWVGETGEKREKRGGKRSKEKNIKERKKERREKREEKKLEKGK